MAAFDAGVRSAEAASKFIDQQLSAGSRTFESGAMRDSEDGKYDFEGFLSPQVLAEFAAYMHKNRFLKDGRVRDSDNWQGGMPRDVYMKSMLRHLMDLWLLHRGHPAVRPETGEQVSLGDTLGGLLFNLQGYWLQVIREECERNATLDMVKALGL